MLFLHFQATQIQIQLIFHSNIHGPQFPNLQYRHKNSYTLTYLNLYVNLYVFQYSRQLTRFYMNLRDFWV